jgi:hypothetical protein
MRACLWRYAAPSEWHQGEADENGVRPGAHGLGVATCLVACVREPHGRAGRQRVASVSAQRLRERGVLGRERADGQWWGLGSTTEMPMRPYIRENGRRHEEGMRRAHAR